MTLDKFGRSDRCGRRCLRVHESVVDMSGKRLINLKTPERNSDAVTKLYVDRNTLKQTDDAIDVKGKRLTSVAKPTADTDAVNKAYLKENTLDNIAILTRLLMNEIDDTQAQETVVTIGYIKSVLKTIEKAICYIKTHGSDKKI